MVAAGAMSGELRSRIRKMASYIRGPPPVLCPGGEVSHPVDGLMYQRGQRPVLYLGGEVSHPVDGLIWVSRHFGQFLT